MLKLYMGIKKWVKRKMAILALATSNVEKDILSQNTSTINNDINHVVRNTKGTLADDLINGEVTQEVMDLRWRTYKILKHSSGINHEVIGKDDDGNPILQQTKFNVGEGLENVKLDAFDNYPLELVFFNDEITIGVKDMFNSSIIKPFDEPKMSKNNEEQTIALHSEIAAEELLSTIKNKRPLIVSRTIFPKFKIEDYTLKLNIRKIDETNKLLEFYVSKYPIPEKKNSQLFINEIKKTMVSPLGKNILEITNVEFTTSNTIGAADFMNYVYEIDKFDKIVEYNGHYVIKFFAKVKINGVDILNQYIQKDLEKKYEKKERRKNKFGE